MNSSGTNSSSTSKRRFATTSWSMVVQAGGDSSPDQRMALESLCQAYWYPLYAFVRKSHSREESEDITQSFFAELLEKKRLEIADQRRGRFRSFLLAALSNFKSNWVRNRNTQKRGGNKTIFSLDFEAADRRFAFEPQDDLTAERLFERSWALTLLERCMQQLGAQYNSPEKRLLFEQLTPYLSGEADPPYSEIGQRVGMTADSVRVAVHRLRKRCRELLRKEISQTVDGSDQVDDELSELFRIFE